jgi:FkbM family methyltransferase
MSLNGEEAVGGLPRVRRFLRRPLREKTKVIQTKVAAVSRMLPVRLPFGAWWVPRADNLGEPLLAGNFENAEMEFVQRFLQPGMTVLDLGAHQGLYTLLASKRVGASGKVFAFEPSPRERRALRWHVALNRCWNVRTQAVAVGNENGEADLFVVQGSQTGCNSLKPPDVRSSTKRVRVPVIRLDDWLEGQKLKQVDFIKLDVEGAELPALQGAARLLAGRARPVILAEVQDVRTVPWGYRAKDILTYLVEKGYRWFELSKGNSLGSLDLSATDFEGNFVACPAELDPDLERRFAPDTWR